MNDFRCELIEASLREARERWGAHCLMKDQDNYEGFLLPGICHQIEYAAYLMQLLHEEEKQNDHR